MFPPSWSKNGSCWKNSKILPFPYRGANKICLNQLIVVNNLRREIIEAQKADSLLQEYKDEVMKGEQKEFSISGDGALMYQGRLCVLKNLELRKLIL